MFFFAHWDVSDFSGINDIFIDQPGFFVVGDTHQVDSIPGHFNLYVVIAVVFELYLSADISIILPIFNGGHIYGDLY